MTSLLITRNSKHLEYFQNLQGIIKTAKDVKNYIKAIFGASSPQFGQVKGIVIRE
ncbi:hypothetical protein IU405_03015 [Polaribacter sp. BAL334]|uniref:hypothetical protein n=1 Tax=Polaribacter sp. BAL334 TaxID=1708178 RepID=UPI0018D23FFC|nr:hypothetical protein [Polaribacter sp. BAL334]MBG7611210.1 hypothetical protein [Polaribacter sp. BAL334]